jgi:hypothetical protein
MKKKKPVVMLALWNYGRIMGVRFTRRDIRIYTDNEITGDHEESARRLKDGSLRFSKVAIREI